MKKTYFSGGCFWCMVPRFDYIDGVIKVYSGYSGGKVDYPTYEQVKSQLTGHRETICIEYDENKVTFDELFKTFLSVVDPFDDGGQFIDRGRSYTLAYYYQSDEEKTIAEKYIKELEESSNKKTYISLEKFTNFFLAEEEHQDFYKKNPKEYEEELVSSGRKK